LIFILFRKKERKKKRNTIIIFAWDKSETTTRK